MGRPSAIGGRTCLHWRGGRAGGWVWASVFGHCVLARQQQSHAPGRSGPACVQPSGWDLSWFSPRWRRVRQLPAVAGLRTAHCAGGNVGASRLRDFYICRGQSRQLTTASPGRVPRPTFIWLGGGFRHQSQTRFSQPSECPIPTSFCWQTQGYCLVTPNRDLRPIAEHSTYLHLSTRLRECCLYTTRQLDISPVP